jgi:hypothetical protein
VTECLWCSKQAIIFCDEWIGGGTRDGLFTFEAPQLTCDAPCCADHSHRIGFVCGKVADSIDRCHFHFKNPVHIWSPTDVARTVEDVGRIQRAIAADARRARFKAVQTLPAPDPGN